MTASCYSGRTCGSTMPHSRATTRRTPLCDCAAPMRQLLRRHCLIAQARPRIGVDSVFFRLTKLQLQFWAVVLDEQPCQLLATPRERFDIRICHRREVWWIVKHLFARVKTRFRPDECGWRRTRRSKNRYTTSSRDSERRSSRFDLFLECRSSVSLGVRAQCATCVSLVVVRRQWLANTPTAPAPPHTSHLTPHTTRSGQSLGVRFVAAPRSASLIGFFFFSGTVTFFLWGTGAVLLLVSCFAVYGLPPWCFL